jgi:SAM-dependent methyltransferase
MTWPGVSPWRPGGLLLDVGSGAGWPGIYMAAVTGARVVLSDIPWEGLRVATRRLTGDGVAGHVVAASAGALPFRDESFTRRRVPMSCVDWWTSSSVLRACHRILRPGGVLCFAVIGHADGLTDNETATAFGAGPDHADAGRGYPSLMATAGFDNMDVTDVTDAHLVTLAAWVREWDVEAVELARIVGARRVRRAAAEAASGDRRRPHGVAAPLPHHRDPNLDARQPEWGLKAAAGSGVEQCLACFCDGEATDPHFAGSLVGLVEYGHARGWLRPPAGAVRRPWRWRDGARGGCGAGRRGHRR